MATTVDATSGIGTSSVGVGKVTVLKKTGITELQGLSAGDSVQAITLNTNCMILGAALVTTTMEDTATVLTVDIGFAAGDTVMDGVDLITGAADGTVYSSAGTNGACPYISLGASASSTDTVDIKVATATGTITEIVCDLYLVIAELS